MKRWISKDSVISKVGFCLIAVMIILGISGSLRRSVQQNAEIQPASSAAMASKPASTVSVDPKPKASVTETRIETTEEAVPYATTQTYDGTLPKDTTVVRVDGANGKKVVEEEVKLKDGKEISRALISETVTVPPVTKVVAVGTKAVPKNQDKDAMKCDPYYTPCIQKTGHDVDCTDIGFKVHLTTPGVDPYGLDPDHNGIGCEDYPEL